MIASACLGHQASRYSSGVLSFSSTTRTATGSLRIRPVQTPYSFAASVWGISNTARSLTGSLALASGTFFHSYSPRIEDGFTAHDTIAPGEIVTVFKGMFFQLDGYGGSRCMS